MPYYAGDYYVGDYYEGDPALLAAVGAKMVGKVGRRVAGRKLKIGRAMGKGRLGRLGKAAKGIAGMIGIPEGLLKRPGGVPGMGRRRMHVTNPKALRRALRRVAGFGKLVKRTKKAIAQAASAVGVRRGVKMGRSGHPPGCRCVHCARR